MDGLHDELEGRQEQELEALEELDELDELEELGALEEPRPEELEGMLAELGTLFEELRESEGFEQPEESGGFRSLFDELEELGVLGAASDG